MSSAVSYKYTGGSTLSGAQPVSGFALNAPNLYDGNVGDTSTYHVVNQTGTGGGNYNFQALIDLGASPPSVSQYELVWNGPQGSYTLFGSNDGTTWTSVASGNYQGGANSGSFAAVTYRYWQVVLSSGGSYPGTLGMSDFRLYDGTSTLISGPSAASQPTPTSPGVSGSTGSFSWVNVTTSPVLNASGFGTNQGLTLTGLSGGAVTISNVVTTGTTTTFSLSRSIAYGETGGVLAVAAGAFSDSSSTKNYNAAASGLAVANLAPSTALAYYYTGNVSGVQPLSGFALNAPNLYDGSVGDTATYNAVTQTSTGYSYQALIDLGPTPPFVTKYQGVYYNITGGGYTLFGSPDGTTWTSVVSQGISGPTIAPFAAVKYRYWQVVISYGGPAGGSIGMSDFRLYDGNGVLINGPSGGTVTPVAAAARPFVMIF